MGTADMSFRSLHYATAAKQIKAQPTIVDLASIEAEELAGGEHRSSLVEEFADRARVLAAMATDDERIEAQLILEGKSGSIILAALEGDPHGDDIKGPEETRDGGGSPSVAADRVTTTAPAYTRPTRVLGRMVRYRDASGRLCVTGRACLRRKE